jgi:predicted phosphodiesterase
VFRKDCSIVKIIAALICVSAAGSFAKITKGPFLLRVEPNRAALMWETDTEGQGKLSYDKAEKPELEKYVVTSPEKVEYKTQKDQNATVKKVVFIHKLWLENLEPGRLYSYRLDAPVPSSVIHSFRTQSADSNEVSFIVYGDSRTHPDTHRRLVELMMGKNVDFIVHTGDLVSNSDDYQQFGPQFFEPLKGLAETVPVYIAKGNHEGNNDNFEKLLIAPGQKNNYSFNFGLLHYFCADNVSAGVKTKEVLDTIAADVRASKAKWKFVSYHIPSVNFGGHWSSWGCPEVFAILAKSGVDFVVTGHSHQYERFLPIAPPAGTQGNFVTYITSGGGGAPLTVTPVRKKYITSAYFTSRLTSSLWMR